MTKMSDLPQRTIEGGPYRTQVVFAFIFWSLESLDPLELIDVRNLLDLGTQ